MNEEVFLVFGFLLNLRNKVAVSIEQEFRKLSSFNLLGQKTQVIIFLGTVYTGTSGWHLALLGFLVMQIKK